ncbi:SAM-dependent DNA methyltransferase [Nocardioides humilatus]|uniref:site-specific DNA-methyltransferase (adenine-specific) n=1 Tax=Nocardioides humilatus TaxID=2607660 RepID=A0A5B1L3P6_9ACTN|nr:class I SAM-dependent DNA methyltransferase [Nocardioides humilatus]KAA1415351.1 SAM-dependent DNA methyltransferase [Nocardioides humilatus]
MAAPIGFEDKIAFVWKVADKLRGHFKQHEYGSVILPLLVLRRLDAVLAATKDSVVKKAEPFGGDIGPGQDKLLKRVAGHSFYNVSPLTMKTLLHDDKNVAANLRAYIRGLSPSAAEVIEAYNFGDKIARMDKAGILYAVLGDFADLDLRPDVVDNAAMGYVFEELLRKFSEMSNETAGEHYTPREVIRLMVDLLLVDAEGIETNPKPVRTVYDPTAGTGGMLTAAIDRITELNKRAIVDVHGQELNDETWAIARSDLMMQGIPPERMRNGNSLTEDAYAAEHFDFILANPPYGVDWKGYSGPIKDEHTKLGWTGRFGAGLPRISDGSLLFLQHMLSKMKPDGSRVGIVLSGSPLFSGAAGSGESEIRRWILQSDLLEGIVALPDQMFYNTGISTYIWVLSNAKANGHRGKVVLVDARELGTKMRRSLGDKRKELTGDAIAEVVRLYRDALDPELHDPRVKVKGSEEFGFQRITVERPWIDDLGKPVLKRGKATPDPKLRDQEDVSLPAGFHELEEEAQAKALVESAEAYLESEVHPYVADAWIDHSKTKLGYEIPFTRQFYVYAPPRAVDEIATEIRTLQKQIEVGMEGLGL